MKAIVGRRALRVNEMSRAWNSVFVSVCLVMLALVAFPLILAISVSLSDDTDLIRHGYSLWPRKVSFATYGFLFREGSQIGRAYLVTTFVTVAGTALSLLISLMFAYPLAMREFPLKGLYGVFLYIPMLFSGGMVATYIVYTRLYHLKDTYFALIMPLLMNPFHIIIMRTYLKSNIVESIVDAARIDGAGEMRILFQIVTTLSLPLVATIGLFKTIGYWNDWFNCLLFITEKDKVTLQYLLYKIMVDLTFLRSVHSLQGGASVSTALQIPTETLRMAMAIIAIGPIALAYPFFQRYFVKGMVIGAIKG